MTITIRDALNIWPLTLGKVVAGQNGLDRVIKSVSVLEIPDETKWFKGGELQISAFYTIAGNENSQIEVLQNLYTCNCSGLILCHIDQWLKSIPEQFIKLANKLNFPIITVPTYLAYTDIITPVMDAILNKKTMINKYALEMSHKMAGMIFDNNNINSIAYSLSQSLNLPTLFFDSNNKCLATGYKEISKEFINEIQEYILININIFNKNEYIEITSDLTGMAFLLVPVIINQKYYGTIAILNASSLSELDMVVIMESKYACGLAVRESLTLNELKLSLRNNYFSDLIEWNFETQSHALKKASELDIEVSKIALVLSASLFKTNTVTKNFNCPNSEINKDKVYNLISTIIKDEKLITHIMKYENQILIFVNHSRNNQATLNFAQTLGKDIINLIQAHMNIQLYIGIGNCYSSISKIKDSYLESTISMKIGNALFEQAHCTLHKDIELFSLLFNDIDQKNAYSIIDKLFSPLEVYDQENNSDLILTFETLISSQFNTAETSDKLFIHRNTVLQRKQKIRELLRYDPEMYPYKQIFELSIIVKKLIS